MPGPWSRAAFSLIAPWSERGDRWQGVLHTAAIPKPDSSRRHVVNSTLVASVPPGTAGPLPAAELAEFLTTTIVRRRGNDRRDLDDDP
jgi:hypothetical protein